MKFKYLFFLLSFVSCQSKVQNEYAIKIRDLIGKDFENSKIILLSTTDCTSCNEGKINRVVTKGEIDYIVIVENEYLKMTASNKDLLNNYKKMVKSIVYTTDNGLIEKAVELSGSKMGPFIVSINENNVSIQVI